MPAELDGVDFSNGLKNSGALLSYTVSIFAKVVQKGCGLETPTIGDNASVIRGLYNLILNAVKAVRRVPIVPAPVKNAAKAVQDGLEDPQVRAGHGLPLMLLRSDVGVAQVHSPPLLVLAPVGAQLGTLLAESDPCVSNKRPGYDLQTSLAHVVLMGRSGRAAAALCWMQVKALEDALEEVEEQDKQTCKGPIMKRVKAFVTSEEFICFRAIIAR
jgi:hypothetical protein